MVEKGLLGPNWPTSHPGLNPLLSKHTDSAHTVPRGLYMCFPLSWTAPSTLVTELPLSQGLWIQDCKPVSTTLTSSFLTYLKLLCPFWVVL